jgi:quercetin dioxygenase-like cupin family protein
MRILRHADTPESPAGGPLFIGEVRSRDMVTGDVQVTVRLVRFLQGARNRLHVHSADQVLYITEGRGVVGTRTEEHAVEAGDIAHIAAGEPHWHGAQPGSDMAHLSILPPCETSLAEDA